MSKSIRYEERFCLFLDLMGFKEIVDQSVVPESKPLTLGRNHPAGGIYFSLKQIASSLKYKSVIVGAKSSLKPSSRVVTQFSDSVVVSYLADEANGLDDMLYDVLHLQLQLIHRGLLIRGAITKGALHHDNDFVFGPALNEAAEFEKLAMYPRVIVDSDLLKAGGISPTSASKLKLVRNAESLLAQDLDGLYYVDYFAVYPDDFDDDWSELSEYLISLREVVKGLSQKKHLSVKMKHSWMRHKFNEVAAGIERSKFRSLGPHRIPEDEEDLFCSIRAFK